MPEFDAETADFKPPPDGFLKDGERRTVSVLFSDMKGFTALSEKSDPEEMDHLMGRVFAKFEAVIRKHGGMVEKYIGDALVAVFGAPELHEDDPARAIDSALEFISSLRRFTEKLPENLAFRTGIHTGLVTTGRRGEFEVVTGHTMAIASRLQSAAPPNGILVSASTREGCEKQFIFGEAQELTVKGKSERLLAYQALARRKAIFDYHTPFVDRRQPLESLTSDYIHHMRGEYHGVYVLGDGGIGKTRLVAEFWARLKAFPDFQATFLAINPSLFGTFEYAAALNAVSDFLDLKLDASFEEFTAAVQERTDLAAEWLADAWGIFSSRDRPAADSRFQSALGALFDAILSSDNNTYPDVIFIDNAHLIDEKSLEFFRGYCGSSKIRPFVVLCDRSKADTVAGVFDVRTVLYLEPLERSDALALAKALDPDGLDDEALDIIVDRAQGYPLFIEEYVKLARQDRDLRHLPESIQTTILAALERLDFASRDLAKRLSILRHPFKAEFACAMHGSSQEGYALGINEMAVRLDRLAAERILAKTGDAQWGFKHSIVREAIHSSLLLHNRKVLHSLAAEYLLRNDQESPADIFHHLTEAEAWTAARSYLVETRPHLPLESLEQLQLLINHCPDSAPGELIELYFIQYATNYNNKVYTGLRPIINQMYHLALRARNRFYLARCYHLMMTSYYMSLDYHSALLYGIKAVEAYEGGGNEKGAANARVFLSLCFMCVARPDQAKAVLEAIPDDPASCTEIRQAGLAQFYRMRGDYREATEHTRALIQRAKEKDDNDELCHLQAKAIIETLNNFQFEEALNIAPAGQLYCGMDGEMTAPYHAALALAQYQVGEGEAANQAFASASYHLAQLQSDSERASAHAAVAWARMLAGDRAEAKALALEGLEAAVRSRHYSAMFECQTTLAELALLANDSQEFTFFVMDAAALAGAPIHRSRKTLARFNYFAWLLLVSSAEARDFGPSLLADETDDFISDAKHLLEEDLSQLSDDQARARQLSLSVFERIMKA